MKGTLLATLILLLVAPPPVASESDGFGEWQILTKQNFSSQIRLHPHILLIVTVPWSGESRSLMREVTRLIMDRQEEFGNLKLMILNRNTEKMLADVVSATEDITILYYHHSVSYKYQGRLRARNILSSINHCTSLLPEELPFKSLETSEDLDAFLESTDKALLLLEFCGWTSKLLARGKNNGTEVGIGLSDESNMGFSGETTRSPALRARNNQKVAEQDIEDSNIKCGNENGFSGIPWIGEFSSINESAPFQRTDGMSSDVGLSCTFEEFQLFESFFSKLTTLAREFFLPPEKQRFGLVSKRSLLSHLGVEDLESWSTMLHFAGCTTCSKILKDGDELKNALQKDNPVVRELEGDGLDLESTLPANKLSILLFVDRSFDLSETRRKSKEALNIFRELALHYQKNGQNSDKPDNSSGQSYQALRSTSGHPRLKLSPMAQNTKLKDKTSVVIIKDGRQITLDNIASDLQGNSLQEILAHLLQQKKEKKLSSLAKDVGFQLLSDDVDIKIENLLVSQTEDQPTLMSLEQSTGGEGDLVTSSTESDNDPLPYVASEISEGEEEKSHSISVESSARYDGEKTVGVDGNTEFIPIEPDHFVSDRDQVIANDATAEEKGSLLGDKPEGEQLNSHDFTDSFLFSDGNYQLLRAMTGGSKIPSLVIIDPTLQQHYIFPEESAFSYSFLAGFLDGFLNGSLLPYQRSEYLIQNPREATRPPFVNMDFHEVHSIPRVTSHSFRELVLGLNQSDTENVSHAWNEDVLVLFTNGWCGFCQRMELVVREVYRAIKEYINMLKCGSGSGDSVLSSCEKNKDVKLKVPHIYLMDCTLNDCGLVLRSMGQRDVYPTLVMFPAERKNAVSYEGDMAVADVIKFMADYGSCSHHLISEKGILRVSADKGGKNENLFKDATLSGIYADSPVVKDKFHEVLLENRTPKRVAPELLQEMSPSVVTGSILIATEKLVSPFDKSTILIVKAEQNSGFLGLIINKPISWDSLQELEEGLQLLKEATLSFGGPLIQRGLPLVALTRRILKEQYPEILPGIYYLDQVATVNEIEELKSGNRSISDYWFFLGYSSWGWDQLFDEIAQGAWNLGKDSTPHVEWPEIG